MVVHLPPVLRIEAMRMEDIHAVQVIERASFPIPWPAYAFRQELQTNRLARYLVARAGDDVVGYAGMWLMVDEAHITTFAVRPDARRQGIGRRLLHAILRLSEGLGATVATLEVRVSNMPARQLYEGFGFRPVGIRARYYSDDGEDALIMTTEPLATSAMQARLERFERELDERGLRSSPRIFEPDAEPDPAPVRKR